MVSTWAKLPSHLFNTQTPHSAPRCHEAKGSYKHLMWGRLSFSCVFYPVISSKCLQVAPDRRVSCVASLLTCMTWAVVPFWPLLFLVSSFSKHGWIHLFGVLWQKFVVEPLWTLHSTESSADSKWQVQYFPRRQKPTSGHILDWYRPASRLYKRIHLTVVYILHSCCKFPIQLLQLINIFKPHKHTVMGPLTVLVHWVVNDIAASLFFQQIFVDICFCFFYIAAK